jgi:tetratricopeptide (TPR) repeat protein
VTGATASLLWADEVAGRRSTPSLDPVLGPTERPADLPDPGEIRQLLDRLFAARDGETLELLGDRLTEWLHRTEALRERPDERREFVSLTTSAYMEACLCRENLMSRVGPKVMALGTLRAKLDEPDTGAAGTDTSREAPDPAAMTEALADSVVDELIPLLTGPALLRQPDGSALLHLGLLVPRLLDLADASLQRNTHLALAVADWVGRQLRQPGRPKPPEALQARARDLEERCVHRMAEVEDRLGLTAAALDAAERSAYRTMYVLHRPEDARRLAHRCLQTGDRLLTAPDDTSDERLDLLNRLFKVSRLTGDVTVVMERSERLQRHIRARGLRHERAERWLEAADSYSNLGYRYFTAAEYTGVSRMYQLAVYFFDKADVLRARAPDPVPVTGTDTGLEPGYRLYESEGFVYGASARLAGPDTAAELYEQAASAHARAAQMAFQSPGLFNLYKAGGHFFNSHAALARCARSADFPTCLGQLDGAARNLRSAIAVTQDVFPLYEATVVRLVRGEADPCTADMVRGLGHTLHPDGAGVAATARTAATALAEGDLPAFHDALRELSRLFVFLHALG